MVKQIAQKIYMARSSRVEVSAPFNAKLYKISSECEHFCKISGECSENT